MNDHEPDDYDEQEEAPDADTCLICNCALGLGNCSACRAMREGDYDYDYGPDDIWD